MHILVFSLILSFPSCMEEQDFNQVDDLEVIPTVTTGILYIESDERTINSSGMFGGIPFYSTTIDFEPFNRDFVADNLLEALLVYEITNTTSKELGLELEFLDEAGTPLHKESFTVGAHPSGIQTREVSYGPGGLDLGILTATSRLRVIVVNWGDATSVSPITDPKLILRSAGEFKIQLL